MKTDSRPLERKQSVPLKDFLQAVLMGQTDEDTYKSLASRLARLDKQLTEDERKRFEQLSGEKTNNKLVHELLDAYNPDKIIEIAAEKFNLPRNAEPDEEQKQEAHKELINKARSTFTGKLKEFIENVRRSHEQIIDNINLDDLQYAVWDQQARLKAEDIIKDFKVFIEAHKDEITALSIFYNQPYNRRDITYGMIKSLLDTLKQNEPKLTPARVRQAYEQVEKVDGRAPKNELTALVSLIRRINGIDDHLTSFEQTANRNFQKWVFEKQAGALKFTDEQMAWLRMIKDHIISSVHIEKEDLGYAPFDGKGSIGKMAQLFGDKMDTIIDEMNEALAA
jgi:type I restriction enzyme R subunit